MSLTLEPAATKVVRAESAARDPAVRWFVVAAVVLAALRFLSLPRWSLWLDEALTLADASDHDGEVNPFGYLLFGWFYGFGAERPDELLLRLPAAVFGVGTILATLWALRPYVGARAASAAAFFLAASTWHLYWSQNARFYTLAQLLALVGGGVVLRGLFGGSTRRTACGLAVLLLAALTHPSTAFLIGPLLCVPWIARWYDWVPPEAERGQAWNLFSAAGLAAIMIGSGWALRVWFRWEARQGSGSPLHFATTAGYLITPTLCLAFLAGVVRSVRARAREAFVPLAATLVGLAAAAIASLFVRVSAQYVFVLQPWIAAGAGLALGKPHGAETQAQRRRLGLLALLVALPGLVDMGLYFTVRRGDRPRWREAYAYVFEHAGAQDLVLGMDAPVAEYYLNPTARDLRQWTAVTWLDDWRARLPLDWARYGRRIWFVVNDVQLDDWTKQAGSSENRADVERMLREECRRVASFEVPLTPRDLDVHVYVTKAP